MSRAALYLLTLTLVSGCFRDLPESRDTETDAGQDSIVARVDGGDPAEADASELTSADAGAADAGEIAVPPDAAADADAGPEPEPKTGCLRDAACGPGAVCIEADGMCVSDDAVAFVTEWGEDRGTCSRAAPCASLPFTLAALGERNVIHVLGGSLSLFSTITLADQQGVIFDGEDTALGGGAATSFAIQNRADVTFEGFRFRMPQPTSADTANITVSHVAKVRFHDVRFASEGGLAVSSSDEAEVTVRGAHIGSLTSGARAEFRCQGGPMTIQDSTLENARVSSSGWACRLTVSGNRFESMWDGSVSASSNVLVMENNLVIHRDGYNDSVSAYETLPGSTIRFNTFVNTTALPSDGAAVYCDRSVTVTSNVFAYQSEHPISGIGCETRYSVFDDVALTSAGTGNRVAPVDKLFVDRAGGDYTLAANSVARGAAEPDLSMVTHDLADQPRPLPQGTRADSGAFESP